MSEPEVQLDKERRTLLRLRNQRDICLTSYLDYVDMCLGQERIVEEFIKFVLGQREKISKEYLREERNRA